MGENTFTIQLAGLTVGVRGLSGSLKTFCRDYLSDAESSPDFTVELLDSDITREQQRSDAEAEVEGIPPRRWPTSYLETLALYRRIAEQAPFFDTILFHSSAIAVEGEGYLFTARSGTGKSTHTRLWMERFGERAVMVNDDKPLLRICEDSTTVYGTPWDGKHHLSCNLAVPVKAICLLQRAETNHIRQIRPEEAYAMLLQQTYRPQDPAALSRTLELLDRMIGQVRLFRLGCNQNPDAALVAYAGMQ